MHSNIFHDHYYYIDIIADSLIEQPKGAADDVYWSDEDDCWKFNKGKFEGDILKSLSIYMY